ncbi:MAG: response regulator, partial [Bacteriovoracaceae bacterium]|nr:response regulator [Bacteriovoracaceae bacterium]
MKEHKNYKILIAEDAPVQGKRLKYFLEKYHYKVDWVTNGKEALDRLKHRNDYALIISDYKMPIMDGIQLLENLKGFDDLSRIPFILLTTFNDDELFLKTLALGANEFLSKPFRPEELKVRVENMVLLYEYQIAIEAQNMNLSSELETKNVLLKQKLIDLKNAYVRQKEMQNELVLRSKMA